MRIGILDLNESWKDIRTSVPFHTIPSADKLGLCQRVKHLEHLDNLPQRRWAYLGPSSAYPQWN